MKDSKKSNIDKKIFEGKNTVSEGMQSMLDFPVVGIGASAGGLEALQDFFKNMPNNSNAAYIVIQHLSPDYKSLMDELLARVTNMDIYRVEDGMSIKKNAIYLIPPGKNMTIFKGKLFLTEQQPGRSLNLPIDIFMRSLAKDQGKNAIGIVLSGTGSDGTLGIRAIKEYGGMVIAQDDQSAKFDGMPRSSISTGMVDYILPAAKMSEELINYIKHPLIRKPQRIEEQINENDNQIAKVIMAIRDEKGVDFSGYKTNTIIRRLEKRISINRYNTIEEYASFLIGNKKEINILFKEFLIGVTKFFRDEPAFEHVAQSIMPEVFKNSNSKKPIRVWSIGCSTGEEAYSLAIVLKEYMEKESINKEVKIFATDIDTESIEFASSGIYPESIVSDINTTRLSKYFNRHEEGYQIKESIRSMVVFAQHNILRDPPFSKIDLLVCRNMLIYLNSEIQQKVLSMFYIALNPEGFLFLGSSESVGDLSEGFSPINSKWKIYKNIKGFQPRLSDKYIIPAISNSKKDLTSISSYYSREKRRVPKIDSIFDEIMTEYLPPSVIVDEEYNIVHTIHRVNKYMSIPVGQVSFNILKMLPEELDLMVSSLLRRAAKVDHPIVYENLKIKDIDHIINISAKKIKSSKTGENYFIVSFYETDIDKVQGKAQKIEKIDINNQYQERIEELEKEIQSKSESLQATVEELETSNEELQSSNEELIASNEELQSTNEELQSVNEELYTVNAEHQKKIEELTQLYADMDNLLKNTQIGTLYLDQDLTIRKFTDLAATITNILRTDVGRPIHHINTKHIYNKFLEDIDFVMETLQPVEKEIKAKNNKWYLLRIIPFRTADNAIDGIIVTFVDITSLIESEKARDQIGVRLDLAFKMGNLSWWEWDYAKNEVITGESKAQMLGYKPSEIAPGFEGWTRLIHPDDFDIAMNAMKEHLEGKSPSYDVEYRIKTKNGKYKWFKDKGGVTEREANGKPLKVAGIVMDITQEKKTQLEKNKLNHILFQTLDNSPQASTIVDPEGVITYANPKARELFDITPKQLENRTFDSAKWKITDLNGKKIPSSKLPFSIIKSSLKPIKDFKHYIQKDSKNKILLSITGMPLFDEQKEFDGVLFTINDITEEHISQKNLKLNEIKYKKLFKHNTDAIYITDKNRNIIDINQSFTNLFGYTIKDVKGKNTEIIYANKDEYKDLGKKLLQDKEESIHTEIEFKKKNGDIFLGDTNKFKILEPEEIESSIIGIVKPKIKK
jgi:two-component system CheB/CheR fusion protein